MIASGICPPPVLSDWLAQKRDSQMETPAYKWKTKSVSFAEVKLQYMAVCFLHIAILILGEFMDKLNLYRIDMKYIRELHKVCDRVPSVSPQIGKDLFCKV
jgi:hypothetical protein